MSESSSSPFLFVRPVQPMGRLDVYSGDHRSHVFERTSWEWLLERTVRRQAILGAVGKKLQPLYLADRKAAYSLQTRTVPRSGSSIHGPTGTYVDFAHLQLPDGDGDPDNPSLASAKVSFAPAEIGGQVVALAETGMFLDPAEPYVEYVSEASLTETSFAHDGPRLPDAPEDWQVETSVVNMPFEPVPVPAFRDVMLRRCADEPVTVDFPEWDPVAGEYVDRRLRAWPVRDPREWTSDGDRPALCPWEGAPDVEVPVLYGVPHYVEYVSRVPVHSRLNLEPYSGPGGLFDRYAVTGGPLSGNGSFALLGCAGPESFPPGASRALAFLGSADRPFNGRLSDRIDACRIPTWDGKPTFWAMHGFPRLDPLPSGSVFRRQLEMLCLAQPCVPPGTLRPTPSSESTGRPGWFRRPFPVACAAEPAEASRMLDLLTCTLIPVSAVYAEVSAVFSESSSSRMWRKDLDDDEVYNSSRSSSTARRVVAGPFVGDLRSLFEYCDPPWADGRDFGLARPSYASTYVSSAEDRYQSSAGTSGAGTYVRRSGGGSCDHAVAETLVPLRSNSGIYMRPSIRTEYTYVNDGKVRQSFDIGSYAVREELETEHLLLQPDVLAWVESAELLAYMDVTAGYLGYNDDGRVEYSHHVYANGLQGDVLPVSHSTKSGTRVHRRKKTLARIGSLDLATGALALDGGLDLVELVSSAVPELPGPGADAHRHVRTSMATAKYTSGTSTASYPRRPSVFRNDVSLFLAVRWKFDTSEPPEPSVSGSGIAVKLALALARVAALSRRRDAASSARYLLSEAVAGLASRTDGLAAALDGADAARAMLEALRSTLASLAAERRDLVIPPAEESPAEHLAAAGRAAELDAAISDVSRRVSALESAATMTRAQAVAALDEARTGIAAARDAADEMDDALRAARDLVYAAREAARGVSGSGAQAEEALDALESAVDALESAVDALEKDLADLDAKVEAAVLAADAAESAVDAAVTVSPST